MEIFATIFDMANQIINIPISIFGYTFNLFNIICFSILGYILIRIIFRFFDN